MVSSRYFEGFVSVLLVAERSTPMLSPQGPLQQPRSGLALDVGERGAKVGHAALGKYYKVEMILLFTGQYRLS
jgi:hypothetical protein